MYRINRKVLSSDEGDFDLSMQTAPSSIPTSGTFFRGDLVMKKFYGHSPANSRRAVECALSTVTLPRRLAKKLCG